MIRFCPNCGTELDDNALFCPSCGQPIERDADDAPVGGPEREPEGEPLAAGRTAPARPHDPGRADEHHEPRSRAPKPEARPSLNVPVTWPVMLSGWLVGGGSAMAALGAAIALFPPIFNAVDLLLLIGFALVAATVFFATTLPTFAQARIGVLAVALIGFGVALDRIGFGIAGLGELLLFLGAGAASIGALLPEIGADQPLGGPGG